MGTKRKNSGASCTLKDIGLACNLTISTVSRVLSGTSKKHVYAPQTIELIKKKAEELGYHPNRLVQGIRNNRTRSIGVFICLGWYSKVLEGICAEIDRENHGCVLELYEYDLETQGEEAMTQRINRLLEHRVDGIILRSISDDIVDQYFSKIYQLGMPLVVIDRKLPDVLADFVGSDDYNGGTKVAEFLIKLGHQNFILQHGAMSTDRYARSMGFKDTVLKAGFNISTVRSSDFAELSLIIKSVLMRKDRATAIFCTNDDNAEIVYKEAKSLGLKIPDDLSVVGYGNSEQSRYFDPPLTTVDQSAYDIGTLAARQIFKRLDGAETRAQTDVLIPTKLIVRQSCKML